MKQIMVTSNGVAIYPRYNKRENRYCAPTYGKDGLSQIDLIDVESGAKVVIRKEDLEDVVDVLDGLTILKRSLSNSNTFSTIVGDPTTITCSNDYHARNVEANEYLGKLGREKKE